MMARQITLGLSLAAVLLAGVSEIRVPLAGAPVVAPQLDLPTDLVQPAAPEGLAREMLADASRRGFIGTLDFQYERVAGEDPSSETVRQLCRLYAGPRGELRLDILPETGTGGTIVCCVSEREAWLIWRDSPLVYRSAYPVPCEGKEGWLHQLRFQAGQTTAWADLLLHQRLSSAMQKSIRSATSYGDALTIGLESVGERGGLGSISVKARYFAKFKAHLPVEVTLERWGTVLTFEDHAAVADGKVIPMHVQRTAEGRTGPVESHWTVLQVQSRSAADPSFLQCFDPPRRPQQEAESAQFPALLGFCLFDIHGRPSRVVWN
jgi:hypothetical protein